MLVCKNLEYGGDQILLSLTLQWEISHELHYSWSKHKNESDLNIWIFFNSKLKEHGAVFLDLYLSLSVWPFEKLIQDLMQLLYI